MLFLCVGKTTHESATMLDKPFIHIILVFVYFDEEEKKIIVPNKNELNFSRKTTQEQRLDLHSWEKRL